jgi:hypothetical protein
VLIHGGVFLDWSLEVEIELLREEMMNVANNKGLIADETIGVSRKLDNLMDQYEELKKATNGVGYFEN